MALILNIETTGESCSVALADDGQLLSLKEITEPRAHSSQLTLLIKSCLDDAGISLSNLAAVAVSSGPGSYTGIRIGVAAAKGICFACDIPLIAINSLLVVAAAAQVPNHSIAVGLHARVDEYYFALYDSSLQPIIVPQVMKDSQIHQILQANPDALVTSSLHSVMGITQTRIVRTHLSAASMCRLSHDRFVQGQTENVALFQPDYLRTDFAV